MNIGLGFTPAASVRRSLPRNFQVRIPTDRHVIGPGFSYILVAAGTIRCLHRSERNPAYPREKVEFSRGGESC
jgi:hypothetical protein